MSKELKQAVKARFTQMTGLEAIRVSRLGLSVYQVKANDGQTYMLTY